MIRLPNFVRWPRVIEDKPTRILKEATQNKKSHTPQWDTMILEAANQCYTGKTSWWIDE